MSPTNNCIAIDLLPSVEKIITKQNLKHSVIPTTWLGKKATCSTIHIKGKPLGLRVISMYWHENGKVEVSIVDGDGRTSAFFKQIAKKVLPKSEAPLANKVIEEFVQLTFN